MTNDEYCGFHTVYYFIVSAIGIILILIGKNLPEYNEITGEIICTYSLPFIVFGVILIALSFVGLIWFCEAKKE